MSLSNFIQSLCMNAHMDKKVSHYSPALGLKLFHNNWRNGAAQIFPSKTFNVQASFFHFWSWRIAALIILYFLLLNIKWINRFKVLIF